MPAWNGFPATYQPMYQAPQYQPGQMYPNAFQNGNNQPMQQAAAPQMMTPPTIRAEIVQVDSEEAARAYPVGAGTSQMMIAKDDSAIFVKSAMANGQTALDIYIKKPPEPPAPAFDPSAYVRKDELEKLIKEAMTANLPPRKAASKEAE